MYADENPREPEEVERRKKKRSNIIKSLDGETKTQLANPSLLATWEHFFFSFSFFLVLVYERSFLLRFPTFFFFFNLFVLLATTTGESMWRSRTPDYNILSKLTEP